MNGTIHLQEEIAYLHNFQQIVQTYQEIAASRMQRVKDSVLHNREYLEEIRDVYKEIINSYEKNIQTLQKKVEASAHKKNATVSIFLSANTKLYGSIIKETFEVFNKYIQENTTDIVIAGRTGIQLYKAYGDGREYTYYDLPDDTITPESLSEITTHILAYKEILVFHGEFEDILVQQPKKTVISSIPQRESTNTNHVHVSYIFEPTLEDVLLFFEKEILASIFAQTVNESNLSKFTSRMVSLNKTNDNVRRQLKTIENTIQLVHHRILDKKQQEQLASISLWT